MTQRISLLVPRVCLRAGVAGCLFAVLALAHSAYATLIISDSFTATDGTALLGRLAAPTDVPAATYVGNGNVSVTGGTTGGPPYEADIQLNMAQIGSDAAVGLNLGIGTPVQFQLTITFNINNDTQTQVDNAHRGAGLGFFSSMTNASGGSSHGFNNFTGLVVDKTGSVRLIAGGADTGVATTVAGFDPSAFHTLSYTVNTASGAGTISSIVLDGATVSLVAPVDTFTVARAVDVGFYNSSGGNTEVASFDNFNVATVPEPAMLAGVIGVLVAVMLHRRFAERLKS